MTNLGREATHVRDRRAMSALLSVTILGEFGALLVTFGIALHALNATGQASVFSLVLISGASALIILSPVAGPLVDRFNRGRLFWLINGIRLFVSVALYLYIQTALNPMAAVYITTFILACSEAFMNPLVASLIPSMLPKDRVVRMNAILLGCRQTAAIVAPAAGGILYSLGNIRAVLICASFILFIALIIQLFLLRVPEGASRSRQMPTLSGILKDFKASVSYLLDRVPLVSLAANGFLSHFLIFPFMLLAVPFMYLKFFSGTEVELGTVQSVYAIGGIAATPLAVLFEKVRRSQNLLFGIVGLLLPACLYLLVLNSNMSAWLNDNAATRMTAFAVTGLLVYFFLSYYVTFFLSFFQTEVEGNMVGRLQSLLVVNHGFGRIFGFGLYGLAIDIDFRLAFAMFFAGALLKIAAHIPFLRTYRE